MKEETMITHREQEILRRLAAQVAELAARPIEQEKRALWYQHNALKLTRPLIFCNPENSWNEILPGKRLECENELARQWEFRLRQEVFWGAEMRDDRVIEPFFDVPHVYTDSGWGLQVTRIGGQDGGAYTWKAPLKDYADLNNLHFPQITINQAATAQALEQAEATLGHLLKVRQRTTWWWSQGLTSTLVDLRGLEQIMLDMMDQPENLHQLMAFLCDGQLAKLEWVEQHGLLSLNNDGSYVGSGGFGWTNELPQPDFSGQVRLKDLWGLGESQETVGISPSMFAEFILPYQLPLLERFGLNCYGCCEPLDKRWHFVKQIPRLRRVSVSPWSNRVWMAEALGADYILSMKPHPADLAMSTVDEERIRADLRRDMKITRDCRVEVIMKDNNTIQHDPRRLIRWVQIAREEAEAI
jgi:hypothetical protein